MSHNRSNCCCNTSCCNPCGYTQYNCYPSPVNYSNCGYGCNGFGNNCNNGSGLWIIAALLLFNNRGGCGWNRGGWFF